jgi:hypothetical protein
VCTLLGVSMETIHSNQCTEVGTGHIHPLRESRYPLFTYTESAYEIFIEAMKGYQIIGPMKSQGGTSCSLVGH